MKSMKNAIENKIIYQMSVHNSTKEGTFRALIPQLDTFKKHGADIIYLLPFYSVGELFRKGEYGSPYCIKDYLSVNPCLGTMEDFDLLVDEIHRRGMRVMIDIVFRHTSYDSLLAKEHPEFFYRDKEGKFYSSVPEWPDIIDLNTDKEEVQDYLLDVLTFYQKRGVDDFRFDVASVLPPLFIRKMRERLGDETILLAESCAQDFNANQKRQHRHGLHPNELFAAGFDLCYHYSSFLYLREYLEEHNKESLYAYKAAVEAEFATNPKGKFILRCIENHDTPRICSYTDDVNIQKSLLAYSFFTPGPAFVLHGEESKEDKKLDFCNLGKVSLANFEPEYYDFYKRLVDLKKNTDYSGFEYSVIPMSHKEQLFVINTYQDHQEIGLFPLSNKDQDFALPHVPDGDYLDLISQKMIHVENETVITPVPLILYRAGR